MSSWGFDKEGTQNAGGANTEDFLVRGFQPFHQADSVASKRNVIGTDLGWVRRVNYTDMHGNARKKEEVIVAANPGSGSYADADHLGFPDISQIYVKLNVNGVVTANTAPANTVLNTEGYIDESIDDVVEEVSGWYTSFVKWIKNLFK